jgi:hypothetical protein
MKTILLYDDQSVLRECTDFCLFILIKIVSVDRSYEVNIYEYILFVIHTIRGALLRFEEEASIFPDYI